MDGQSSHHLLNEALGLPIGDRGRLAAQLIESLDPEMDADANEAWSDEIRQRLLAIDEGRVKMVSWQDARSRIRGQDGTAAD